MKTPHQPNTLWQKCYIYIYIYIIEKWPLNRRVVFVCVILLRHLQQPNKLIRSLNCLSRLYNFVNADASGEVRYDEHQSRWNALLKPVMPCVHHADWTNTGHSDTHWQLFNWKVTDKQHNIIQQYKTKLVLSQGAQWLWRSAGIWGNFLGVNFSQGNVQGMRGVGIFRIEMSVLGGIFGGRGQFFRKKCVWG